MLNFGDGTHMHATFEADGSVDLDDRQHLLDLYSGIALAAPGVPVVTNKHRGFLINVGRLLRASVIVLGVLFL